MATTLTRNLKLKISSNFDDISKYNLNRLDTLASLYQTNLNDEAIIRSKTSILLTPNSADIGGTGVGGTIQVGSADQELSSLTIYASSVSFTSPLTLADQASGGSRNLVLQYKSDISGSVDTSASRTLSVDMSGGDRNLVLGGNLSLAGGDFSINLGSLTSGQVLTYNASTQSWENDDPGGASSSELVATWAPGEGETKTVTHGFNSRNVTVQIFDENFRNIEVDNITRDTVNSVTLMSSNTPTGSWTVLITKLED